MSRMRVVEGTGRLDSSIGRLFAVVGVFDGLHRGHDYLLGELRRAAADHDASPAVITFDHHPDEILKGAAPPLLCDPEERLQRFAAAGVEITVIETFDRALRETPYDAWVGGIAERVELAGFLMTPESAFGYERRGTPETVAALGRDLAFDVVVVPQFTLDGEPVRSSDVRSAIAAGDLAQAERLLGRPYSIAGLVGSNATVSFDLPVAMPPQGVYAATIATANRPAAVGDVTVTGPTVSFGNLLRVSPGDSARVTFDRVNRAAPSRLRA